MCLLCHKIQINKNMEIIINVNKKTNFNTIKVKLKMIWKHLFK